MNDSRVISGTIKAKDGISIHDNSVYVGHCDQCPDQCGAKTQLQ
jgi:hypothetical protein